jgi:hypothetical protein
MDTQARQQWIDDATQIMLDGDQDVCVLCGPTLASSISRTFQAAGDHERAISVFDQFIEVFAGMDGDKARGVAKQLKSTRDQVKSSQGSR